jgi:tetratricopeptide (TPR) repeat protein
MGDREGVLTVQVGIANTYLAKGNLPQAQSILDDVIMQADGKAFEEIRGKALHTAAAIAHRRGNPGDGLKLAYEGLALIKDPAARDFVLGDIAALFTEVGMRDAARDAHLILAATAQSKLLQWTASLNLMDLESLDGNEEAFDSYARELARVPMGVWLRSHYLLALGEGFERFGRYDAAADAFRDATSFAEANQIHQVAFKAQAALDAVERGAAKATSAPSVTWVPDEVNEVARGISDLRKSAVAP